MKLRTRRFRGAVSPRVSTGHELARQECDRSPRGGGPGSQRAVLFRHRGEAFTLSRATISDGCFEFEKLTPQASGHQIVPGLLVATLLTSGFLNVNS